jgi:hypothetical protein
MERFAEVRSDRAGRIISGQHAPLEDRAVGTAREGVQSVWRERDAVDLLGVPLETR